MCWEWFKSHYNHRKKSLHESWLLYFPPGQLPRFNDRRGKAVSVLAFSSGNLRSFSDSETKQEHEESFLCCCMCTIQSRKGRRERAAEPGALAAHVCESRESTGGTPAGTSYSPTAQSCSGSQQDPFITAPRLLSLKLYCGWRLVIETIVIITAFIEQVIWQSCRDVN